jgi:hypothetical protein
MKDARQHLEAMPSAAGRWKGHLEHLLPKTRRNGKVRGPQPSLPYEDLPAFTQQLAGIDSMSADAGTHYPDVRPNQ